LLADSAGSPIIISDEIALQAKAQAGTDMILWASFQPLYDLIYAMEPNFLK
jgi:plasmid maintenance system antidote protein VapI